MLFALILILQKRLREFCDCGGKVLATGKSALYENSNEFCLNLGAEWIKENPYKPDYFRPLEK